MKSPIKESSASSQSLSVSALKSKSKEYSSQAIVNLAITPPSLSPSHPPQSPKYYYSLANYYTKSMDAGYRPSQDRSSNNSLASRPSSKSPNSLSSTSSSTNHSPHAQQREKCLPKGQGGSQAPAHLSPKSRRIASLSAAAELDIVNFLEMDYSSDSDEDEDEINAVPYCSPVVSVPGLPDGLGTTVFDDVSSLSMSSVGQSEHPRPSASGVFSEDVVSSTISSAITSTAPSVKGTTAFYKSNYGSDSTVNMLPTETSVEMYRKNAHKTSDSEVLFSFAKMLIKTAMVRSKGKKSPISEETREEYLLEAHSSLKKVCRTGYLEAQHFLGDAYSIGLFSKGKPDTRKALNYFETAGKGRHAESAYRTAVCYRKGWGCTPDSRKVVKFVEIAAMKSHPVAMMEYGIYLFHGLMGLPEDVTTKKKGISWLKRATEAATQLSCGAPYELAMIYMYGYKDIVIKDVNYAVKLLFQAANLGHAKSAALLGKFYEMGEIVESNADLSIHFYNMAAELGNSEGMMGLCSWYFVGSEKLPKDYGEAFTWAQKAAEKGDLRAMLSLRRFYELGIGCKKDLEKASHWAKQAGQIESLKETKAKRRNFRKRKNGR
ncbi:hypothetical protein FOA43_003542 [Brettanomyces nanus]|uniref:Uncharacterized protein n=1 Tax=Eeniella nana TaxID=13502 RepID=A0A875S4C4_EENNA|nr:uncharacterized protein FOA43_003542 [Brettanomyces nanus]QPG76156.1 hypothetical protein FOA43_003542 [Brettanomyces nanus]